MSPDRAGPAERMYLRLVADYQAAILNYLYRLVGDVDIAEDLTQDTFIKAYRALDRLELDEAAEPRRRAWLYRIAHNTATDHLRRGGRLQWLSLEALRHHGGGDPAPSAEGEPVRQALAALSAEHRQVLLLFGPAGLDAAEVGEVLGITPEAARKRRQRAREAFEAAFRHLTGEDPR
jgi:RNA polymerase sigma-70 factor (ECF subfamily)